MSKLEARTVASSPTRTEHEVRIPLAPGQAILVDQSLRHLRAFEKRALDRLGTTRRAADVTAVDYRVEGADLVVHVLQGSIG